MGSRNARASTTVELLRIVTERLLMRGLRYRLLLAGTVILIIAVMAGLLVVLLDPGFSGIGEGVWWAFLRLSDPGYLGDDEGMVRRAISTVVTVLGYLLFLGLLVAILTQWLNELITDLESGVTPIALSDHVLILGWTHSTVAIVEELMRTRLRLKRFLDRHGVRRLRIVILADRVDRARARELRERLGGHWNDRQLFLRAGTPTRLEHLERVAFLQAAVLILPGASFGEKNPEAVDSRTIKTLMSISQYAKAAGTPPPLAVAELFDARRAAVARRAYAGEAEIVAADDILSRLIVQSVRRPGVYDVYHELLTVDDGNAIYVLERPGLVGERFGDLQERARGGILLGTVRTAAERPALNPDREAVLEATDQLVVLARRYANFELRPAGESAALPPPAATPAHSAGAPPAEPLRRVLMLGWSRKSPALLHELARYGADSHEVDVVSLTPVEQRERGLTRRGDEQPAVRVRQIEAGFTVPGVLEQLDVTRYDNVVLLASERLGDQEHADSTTAVAYSMLRDRLSSQPAGPNLFVELMHEDNRFLFAEREDDVMVSPMMVSYLLSQVALRRELATVFDELTRPFGPEIVLHPLTEYATGTAPVNFDDLSRAAEARGEIALGLRHQRNDEWSLDLNPDAQAAWRPTAEHALVVLTPDREEAVSGGQ